MTNALGEAVRAGDLEKARALVASGIDPNARDGSGSTALYGVDDTNAVRILLDVGADPNLESTAESEGLPLCFAACWGDHEVVSALLEGGADPNLCEDHGDGSGPLVWAARGGHLKVAEALLDAGADPNAADGYGRTPLDAATRRGSASVVQALLAAGADPDSPDADGTSPLTVAEEWAHKNVESELRLRAERLRREGERITVRKVPCADGTERIEVFVGTAGTGSSFEMETGFDRIVGMLRAASGSS